MTGMNGIKWAAVLTAGMTAGCASFAPKLSDLTPGKSTSTPKDSTSKARSESKANAKNPANPLAENAASPATAGKDAQSIVDATKAKKPVGDIEPAAPIAAVRRVPDAKSSLRDQVEPVGKKLAAAAQCSGVTFQFDSLYNPRPKTQHTANGHIYITSGMLEQLKTTDELAAVLALEMVAALNERRAPKVTPAASLPDAGPLDDYSGKALAAKTAAQNAPSREAIRLEATVLLEKAGYRSVDLAATWERMDRLVQRHPAAAASSTLKVSQLFGN